MITRIQRATSFIANTHLIGSVGRYKVYPTTNVYNSLKLDTATGKVTALQISLGDTYGMEYNIADAVVPDETINQGTRKGDGKMRPKSILIRLNLKRATVTKLVERRV